MWRNGKITLLFLFLFTNDDDLKAAPQRLLATLSSRRRCGLKCGLGVLLQVQGLARHKLEHVENVVAAGLKLHSGVVRLQSSMRHVDTDTLC